ncbi:MAG: D-glutamate deacylase [Halieaceae bacterium MED-G27]|nr:D-glutamate deacylase [Halieaceae bacterium]PDH34441.1 MAG: D-glutamate deacylase [Halieaceae bacterium MED-G27]|tara:strand:+ start:7662 stop:9185 length:1524 start_codon:yes stop_codon:yes gene_type:complete
MINMQNIRRRLLAALLTGSALTWLPVSLASEALYDTVILKGRVIDPETEFDQIANLGIKDGQIAVITSETIVGSQTIDASGRVVSPGFIDIHSHTPTRLGEHLNILDGITTQLDLEAGAWPPTEYGDHYIGGAQLNYGSSVGHFAVRHAVMEGRVHSYFFTEDGFINTTGPTWTEGASAEQIEQMRIRLIQGLEEGGLGIGVLLDYMTDAVSESELQMIFETAASVAKPVYIHVRRGMPGDPNGLDEAIALAEATGAPTMICHITHSAMGGINEWLAKIDEANARGAHITTETLSWLAGGTAISADVFRNRDWRAIFNIDYEDVQWVPTGEWLDEERFLRYQRDYPGSSVNHHYVKEAWLLDALKWPDMMVSTDALPAFDLDVKTNPNIAGTFSHFLGRYVRDLGVMPLMEGLRRITLLPAQWLELSSDAFAKKGRLQVGADADIVVFDPDTIAAEAAYGDPYQPSVGISTVLVGGRLVASEGRRIEGRYPGKHILAPLATTTKFPY